MCATMILRDIVFLLLEIWRDNIDNVEMVEIVLYLEMVVKVMHK